MQIVIFLGNNNLFYISTKSNLNHSQRLKSEATLRGQNDLGSSEIDLLTLLSDVNVTPTQIAQIMKTLRWPQGGTFMPKCVYDMNQKTKELHDFATGLLQIVMMPRRQSPKLNKNKSTTFIFFMKIVGFMHVPKAGQIKRQSEPAWSVLQKSWLIWKNWEMILFLMKRVKRWSWYQWPLMKWYDL
jgi:hypothetical protein